MKKIVFIGGGGGSKNILPGLKNDFEVTAIVTVFDNGGSYGKLRYQYKTLLTGDVRNALVSLSANDSLSSTFNWRFEGGDLKGHSLGNIILANLYDNLKNYEEVLALAHRFLEVKGKVLPVSFDWAELFAELTDGTIIEGETNVDEVGPSSKRSKIKKVFLSNKTSASPAVLESIEKAELIVIGPGDLYTSIIPNLLVDGISEAIRKSKAKKVYFVNLMTTLGQTDLMTAADHVNEIENYLGGHVLDYVIVNTSKLSQEILDHHKERGEEKVLVDEDKLQNQHFQVIKADLLADKIVQKAKGDQLKRSIFINDPGKVLKLIKQLTN